MPPYRTLPTAPVSARESDALVVHCGDPRYQPHFQQLLRDHLGLDRYALVAVPGGPQCLTLADYLPEYASVGWRWLDFFHEVAHPKRIVLITHDDCRWYHDARFAPLYGSAVLDHQLADLRRVRAALVARFGAVTVDAWFARLEGDCAEFEEVI